MCEELAKDGKPVGVNCFVSGTIPPSAGLSSSSALVVAATLVTVWAHGLLDQINRSEIANLCARSERFIGTQGGGMDQAIQVLISPLSYNQLFIIKLFEHGFLQLQFCFKGFGAKKGIDCDCAV